MADHHAVIQDICSILGDLGSLLLVNNERHFLDQLKSRYEKLPYFEADLIYISKSLRGKRQKMSKSHVTYKDTKLTWTDIESTEGHVQQYEEDLDFQPFLKFIEFIGHRDWQNLHQRYEIEVIGSTHLVVRPKDQVSNDSIVIEFSFSNKLDLERMTVNSKHRFLDFRFENFVYRSRSETLEPQDPF